MSRCDKAILCVLRLDCSEQDKGRLYALTGSFQALTRDLCDVYYQRPDVPGRDGSLLRRL